MGTALEVSQELRKESVLRRVRWSALSELLRVRVRKGQRRFSGSSDLEVFSHPDKCVRRVMYPGDSVGEGIQAIRLVKNVLKFG